MIETILKLGKRLDGWLGVLGGVWVNNVAWVVSAGWRGCSRHEFDPPIVHPHSESQDREKIRQCSVLSPNSFFGMLKNSGTSSSKVEIGTSPPRGEGGTRVSSRNRSNVATHRTGRRGGGGSGGRGCEGHTC